MRGYLEIELGGQKRPLKFGTNAGVILCELRGITLKEVRELIDPEKMEKYEIDGSEIRDMVYSALVAAARSQNLEVDFNESNVGDWLDEIQEKPEIMMEIVTVMAGGSPQVEKKRKRRKQLRVNVG